MESKGIEWRGITGELREKNCGSLDGFHSWSAPAVFVACFNLIRRSAPSGIDGEILRGTFCRSIGRQEQRHVGDVFGQDARGQALPFHHFLFELGRVPEFDLAFGPDGAGRDRVDANFGGPYSRACVRVRPMTAALQVLYAGRPVCARRQMIELMLMMEPPPRRFICGAIAWAAKNMWRRLVAMRSSQ